MLSVASTMIALDFRAPQDLEQFDVDPHLGAVDV